MADNRVKGLTQVFKLLSEPSRLRILYSLGLDCRPVSDIVQATGLTQTNVSFHLRLLREAGLVRPERRGPFVDYCLADPEILEILRKFGEWFEGQAANVTVVPPRAKGGDTQSKKPKTVTGVRSRS